MKELASWGARWGIVADDLTGACDTGVYFAARGLATRVKFNRANIKEDITALSTDSRNDPAKEARRKVEQACESLRSQNITVIYKKVDSTLKGNIDVEIETVMRWGGYFQAVISPAFPDMGRIYRHYQLCGSDSVPAVAVSEALVRKQRFIVADAECGEDLALIARSALQHTPTPLFVGSGGLAMRLASLLKPSLKPQTANLKSEKAGSVVLFIGSTHSVTEAQVAKLATIQASHTVVRVPVGQDLPDLFPLWASDDLRGIIVSGGDTAAKVCGALGVGSILLQREVITGLPWGRIEGGKADGLAICTKAGSFGREDALAIAVEFLARQPIQIASHHES